MQRDGENMCRTCAGRGTVGTAAGVLPKTPQHNLRCFGDEEHPLHASSIPTMIKCTWSAALMFIFDTEYESSEAADTGSACHVAVAEWHRRKDIKAAVEAMRDSANRYPQANLQEAAALFLLYQEDPRNKEAEIAVDAKGELLIERKITVRLPPAENDPTQKEIVIIGTMDQVRIGVDTRPKVWDLKTSKRPGWDLMNAHIYQLGAYALGASFELKKQVGLGGLICPRHYKNSPPAAAPSGVFWPYPNRFNDLEHIVRGIQNAVALIRGGQVMVSPSDQCKYCNGKGTEECLPLLGEVMDPVTRRIKLL